MKEYEKWNNYKIGNINWIIGTAEHPFRFYFINYILNTNNNIKSVIEIGPGELLEYQKISKVNPNITYTIVDVSDLFIANCKKKFPNVETIQQPLESLTVSIKRDIVFCGSVIEHSRDPEASIKNLLASGDKFFISMFKWSYGGGLKPVYHEKRKFWSTSFNVWKILELFNKYGTVESTQLCKKKNGKLLNFDKYSKSRRGDHRTGDYLLIQGTSNC